jgi:large repetitive protein
LTIQLSHLTVIDPDNTYPNGFSVDVAPGNNYSISEAVVTPSPNFSGTLTVPVKVNDGINNSALFNLTITVNTVNDPPSFDPIPNEQVMENSGEHEVTIRNISKGQFEDTQSLVFFASSGDTKIISDPIITHNGTAATARLAYNVLPNISGVVTITIRAVDNATNAATFTSTFQVTVIEINATPTLDAMADLTMQEDGLIRDVALTGITAGIGESQQLTVTVSTPNPEFFDPAPQIIYQSPSTSGILQLKPKSNAHGSTTLTVSVTDNGSGISPNVNTVSRTFNVLINSINDIPVFKSNAGLIAVLNEQYAYDVEIEDVEGENITFSFPQKPAWMNFTESSSGRGKLSGTPNVAGNVNITITATDNSGGTVEQTFQLKVNTRPVVSAINVNGQEDDAMTLPIASAFSDADGNTMAEIKITKLPHSGTLKVGNQAINSGTVIPSSSLSSLVYEPLENFSGKDTVWFTASDGLHYSLKETYAVANVNAVNDPPIITEIETDTLKFEIGGIPVAITSTFEADDVDDENFSGADIAFIRETYKPEEDVLLFESTSLIAGSFNSSTGSLSLTGRATKSEYIQAIRSIQYAHLNTVNPVLETKTLNISVNDGKNLSNPKGRLITPTYTFTELKIPTGFTPNGDNINDTWIIAQPGGSLKDAVVQVFSKDGGAVYKSTGFENPWDGTFNGELLPPDTYYFTIDLNLPSKKTYKGFVTLLR